jgi:hypothetical protein
MYRSTDLEVVKLHFQELYDEAARNRLIKQSRVWEEHRKHRRYMHLLNGIGAWMVRWQCILQSQFSQNLLPGLRKLAADQNPCLCAPEPSD